MNMDTVLDIVAANGVPFRVRLVRTGERYGLDRCLVHGEPRGDAAKYGTPSDEPMAEFYDLRHPAHDEPGQFVSRYYVDTLLGRDKWGSGTGGLDLLSYEPSWKVDAATMDLVRAWLRHQTAVRP